MGFCTFCMEKTPFGSLVLGQKVCTFLFIKMNLLKIANWIKAPPPRTPPQNQETKSAKMFLKLRKKFQKCSRTQMILRGGAGGRRSDPTQENLTLKSRNFKKVLMHTFCPTPNWKIQREGLPTIREESRAMQSSIFQKCFLNTLQQ